MDEISCPVSSAKYRCNLANNNGGGQEAGGTKSSKGVRNFNLQRSQVRKGRKMV